MAKWRKFTRGDWIQYGGMASCADSTGPYRLPLSDEEDLLIGLVDDKDYYGDEDPGYAELTLVSKYEEVVIKELNNFNEVLDVMNKVKSKKDLALIS